MISGVSGRQLDNGADREGRAPPHIQPGGGRHELTPPRIRQPGGDRDADPAGQPLEQIRRRGARIEVGGQAVQGGEHRGEQLIESLAQPLREAVVGVEPGKSAADRMRRGQAGHDSSHITRTWC